LFKSLFKLFLNNYAPTFDLKIYIMENLSLSNSCINCENLTMNSICDFHKITVNEKYTCEEFENNPA